MIFNTIINTWLIFTIFLAVMNFIFKFVMLMIQLLLLKKVTRILFCKTSSFIWNCRPWNMQL